MKKQPHILKYLKFNKVVNCLPELKKLANAKSDKQRVVILSQVNDCVINAISEIAKNCLHSKIPLRNCDFKSLKSYQHILRLLQDSSLSTNKRKQIIIQNGGFLSFLIRPAIALISTVLAEYVGKRLIK